MATNLLFRDDDEGNLMRRIIALPAAHQTRVDV